MKKIFEIPELIIIAFTSEDIVTTSIGDTDDHGSLIDGEDDY